MKAIETLYRGYRFRSRCEARWAVFFDSLRLKWEYEKEGYELKSGWYLPDFWLPGSEHLRSIYPGAGCWVEIKGTEPKREELDLLIELCGATQHNAFLVYGTPGESSRVYKAIHVRDPGQADFWCKHNGFVKMGVSGRNLDEGQLVVLIARDSNPHDETLYESKFGRDGLLDIRMFSLVGELASAGPAFDPDTLGFIGFDGEDGVLNFSGAVAASRSARFEHGESPNA